MNPASSLTLCGGRALPCPGLGLGVHGCLGVCRYDLGNYVIGTKEPLHDTERCVPTWAVEPPLGVCVC